MDNLVPVIVNNRPIKVPKTFTVLQACEQAFSEVPRFCYHEKLSVAGNCRMCLVEIEKSPKPVVACAMPVMPDMFILTNTPLVMKARESIIEFLLINHPLDCPICDQGGECDLQDQTLAYGSDKSRYYEYKRSVEDKNCGPTIKTIMTRCIHCTRCIRFASEIGGKDELGAFGRGEKTEIGTYINKFIKSELSGNMIDLCPVGALTSGPFPFISRNWELDVIKGIDFTDAVGSNTNVYTKQFSMEDPESLVNSRYITPTDHIIRVLPYQNDDINESWISNKTRFIFDGVTQNRLVSPIFIKKDNINEVDWKKTFPYINNLFKYNLSKNFYLAKYKKLTGIFGKISDAESIYSFFQFLNELGSNNIQCDNKLLRINNDISLFYKFNTTIKNIEQSDLILLIGINPRVEATLINARIKKHTNNNPVTVALIGTYADLTYDYLHLGNSTKTLLQMAEGRHLFCQELRKAKNPILILGTSLLYRLDSEVILNITRFLGKNMYLNTPTMNGYNILHANIGTLNACSINALPGTRSHLYNSEKVKNYSEILYTMEMDNFIHKKWINDKTTLLGLSSHLIPNLSFYDSLFPSVTHFEKNNIMMNVEGYVQQSYQSITAQGQSRKVNSILADFGSILGFNEKNFEKRSLFFENPQYAFQNQIYDNFKFPFLNYSENKNKLTLSIITPLITNYYMTDIIGQNSTVMSEHSILLEANSNFIKLK